MTRLASTFTLTAVLLAGCAGPIQTRVQTISSVPDTQLLSFGFSELTTPNSETSDLIKQELRKTLKSKGLEESEPASLLLSFSIAERPASIAIKLGEGNKFIMAAAAKENKPFQSCQDREHRLIVTLTQRDSGEQHYRGTAAEYHCKADIKQSLPFLVEAALSELGNGSGIEASQKILTRRGLE